MLATRPANTLTSLARPLSLDMFVGSALELVIHSVEHVRARVMRLVARRR